MKTYVVWCPDLGQEREDGATIPATDPPNKCKWCGHDIHAHDKQYGCAEDGCDCETPNDWIKRLQEQDEPHPLAGQHISQGSMDAAADAYEAEYNAARMLEALKAAAQFVETEHFPIGWSVDRIREVIGAVASVEGLGVWPKGDTSNEDKEHEQAND